MFFRSIQTGGIIMEQKFSLAYLTVVNTPPPEMIYMAANAGYDYVSLRPIYMGLPGEPNYSLATNKQLLGQTKKALKDTGLELLDIELARIDRNIDVHQYEKEFEICAELGAKHVLSSIWTDDRSYYIEQFAALCDLADEYGLTVELEFVPIASVKKLSEAVDVLNTVNKQNAGLLIDIHHFHRAGDRVEDLKQLPEDWYRFVHLCDATKD